MKNNGFTLLEVLVAMMILIVGILSLVKMFPTALQISRMAEQTTIAANLAQAKIEEVFYLDYENIDIGTLEAKHRLSDDSNNPFYSYQRQTETEYIDGNLDTSITETGLKKITVTVFWNNPLFFTEKSQSVSMLISEK